MSGVQPALDRQRSERRARWSTAIVGLSGLAGIALCDGLEGQMGVFALAICGFGWAMPRVLLTQFFKWVSPFVAVALIVSPVVFGMDWVSAGIALVLYLQIFKSWTAVTARDHRVCLLLALLMALLASTLTQSVFFALSLIVVAMVTPVALLQLHLWQMEEHKPHRPEMVTSRGRTFAALSLGPVSLLGMLAFFLIIPRFRGGYLAAADDVQGVAGFGSNVDLGDIGSIKDNPSMVMRVEAELVNGTQPRGPFYFRGMALDLFNGSGWQKSDTQTKLKSAEKPPAGLRGTDLRMEILLEPLGAPVLFGVSDVLAMHVPELTMREGQLDNFLYFGEPRRVPYTVWSREPSISQAQIREQKSVLNEADFKRYTALPASIDPRIAALAKEIVGDAQGPFAKSYAIERWLRTEFTYTLVPQPGQARQSLARFLFETKAGHCEYFATALAVLSRAVGVPSVLVSGFYGGEWNELGDFLVVRQADAHAWVEIRVGDTWVQRDATPSGEIAPPNSGFFSQLRNVFTGWWERRVLDYDLYAQAEAVGALSAFLGLGGAEDQGFAFPKAIGGTLVVFFLSIFALSRLGIFFLAEKNRRRKKQKGIAGILGRASQLARNRGWRIPVELTPLESARWLQVEAGNSARSMVDLAWFYYRCHYGSESEIDLIDDAKDALLALGADLPEAIEMVDEAEGGRYH
jgi:hypothetical protein